MTNPIRVLSLGAGVQSTTVLYMMLRGEIQPADHVIFADTGWEPTAVYKHLDHLKALMQEAQIPFHQVSIGNIRQDALKPNTRSASMPLFMKTPDGKKGMVRRQCTNEYKIQPLLKEQRRLVGLKKGQRSKDHLATTVIGISYDESQRMRDAAFPWIRNEYPLVDMKITREDCLDWCKNHGYDKPPRSACIGCPFKSNDEWRRLKDETPTEWADAVDFDYSIRTMMTADDRYYAVPYLHSQMEPLDLVDLRTIKEKGQDSLFDQECEGMCGV
jgi:hypothetical protein